MIFPIFFHDMFRWIVRRLSFATYLSFQKITNYNYSNLYKIPTNVLPSGNSINVTRVARVLVEERYFVYCASYETAFTFLN